MDTKEKPVEKRPFEVSLVARLAISVFGIPAVIFILYLFSPPDFRRLPILLGYLAFGVTLVWIKKQDKNDIPSDEFPRDLGCGLCSSIGACCFVVAVTHAISSFLGSGMTAEWVRKSTWNGTLGFFIAASIFGARMFYKGYAAKIHYSSIPQYLVLLFAMVVLSFSVTTGLDSWAASPLSYVTILAVGDWVPVGRVRYFPQATAPQNPFHSLCSN